MNDGNWTLEELMRVNTLVARNLDDGDPSNDIYGALYDRHSMRSQLVSAGLKVTSIAENGAVGIIANDPQNVNICDDGTH